MIHELKTWPQFFEAVATGKKTFEVRKADRQFAVGEVIRVREWDPASGEYTGRICHKAISYRLDGGQFGVETGYCVLGLCEP